jgi:hypothetical protein
MQRVEVVCLLAQGQGTSIPSGDAALSTSDPQEESPALVLRKVTGPVPEEALIRGIGKR